MDYWEECILEAFEENRIKATEDQIKEVVGWVKGAHENYGMAYGYDQVDSPSETEADILRKELEKERGKIFCKDCEGTGSKKTSGPAHYSYHNCNKCKGTGKI